MIHTLFHNIKSKWQLCLLIFLLSISFFTSLYLTRPTLFNFLPKAIWIPVSFLAGIVAGMVAERIITFLVSFVPQQNRRYAFGGILLIISGFLSYQSTSEVHRTRFSKIDLALQKNENQLNETIIIQKIIVDDVSIAWLDECTFLGDISADANSIRLESDAVTSPGRVGCVIYPKSRHTDIEIRFMTLESIQGIDISIGNQKGQSSLIIINDDGITSAIFDAPLSTALIASRLSFLVNYIFTFLVISYLLIKFITFSIPSLKSVYGFFFTFMLILWLPAIWYSLNTRFALIDDYNSFYYVFIIKSVKVFLNFVKNFIVNNNIGRYRPIYEIYNALTWSWFGENYTLHHLARLALMLVIVVLSTKILKLYIPQGKPYLYLSILLFSGLFLFYPNHPEARLAPQECLLVFFCAILFYGYATVLVKHGGDILGNKALYVLILVSFLGMHLSKETGIFLGISFLLVSFIFDPRRWRHSLAYLPLWIIFGHSSSKIYYMSQHPELYGVSKISKELIIYDSEQFLKKIFLTDANKILPSILIIGLISSLVMFFFRFSRTRSVLHTKELRKLKLRDYVNADPLLPWLSLVLISIITFFTGLTIQEGLDLRYYYPLTYLLALYISSSLSSVWLLNELWQKILTRFSWICVLFFITFNYYNFMYQFATQYYHRQMESQVLNHIETLLKNGETVYITIDAEYEDKIRDYFTGYLPKYHHATYTNIHFVEQSQVTCPPQASVHYITRRIFSPALQDYILSTSFVLPAKSQFFTKLETYATYLGPGDKAFFYVDGGADTMGTIGWQDYYYLGQACPQP
jgi:hypothetical protein